MSFGLKDVERVLDAFEASDWDEIRLVGEGFKLQVLSRSAAGGAGLDGRAHEGNVPIATPADAKPAPPGPPERTPTPEAAVSPAPGDGVIEAPALGVFWRSPRPGAPPFVDVGDFVTPDTTICIVEVMKLMTPVMAGVTGRITRVLTENGGYIDRGQPLFTFEPAEVDAVLDLADGAAT